MKVMIIINPVSGTRSKENLDTILEERFRSVGVSPTIHYTTGPEDGRRLAGEAARSGYDLVVAVGGDGTVNEVASALCHTETALGIVPCGSGNGLARTLQIPQAPERAIDIIMDGNLQRCDYGTVNGRPFFCTFGVGFDAAVAHKFASANRRGKLTYIKNTLEEYLSYRPASYALLLDDKIVVKEAFLIAVCNVSQYGNNVYIAPNASVCDGWLDVTLVRSGTPVDAAMAGLGMLAGAFGPNKTVESFRVKKAVISRLEPGPAHIDGEPCELGTRMEIRCHDGALKVLVPRVVHKFKPIITPVQSFFTDLGDDLRHYLTGK